MCNADVRITAPISLTGLVSTLSKRNKITWLPEAAGSHGHIRQRGGALDTASFAART